MSFTNQPPIPIVPSEMVTVTMITGFTYDVTELVANTSATFRVVIYSDYTPKKVETVKLEGQAYTNWGNDDDYVAQYIAGVLGFTLAP